MRTRAEWAVVRTDAAQPWHARLTAANGEILVWSEGYTSEAHAHRVITLACEACAARLVDPMRPVPVLDERTGAKS